MKMANATYRILYQESLNHQYNEVVIDKLKNFDYSSLQEEFKFIPSVFEKVKYYLHNGDVRGMYKEIAAITSDLYADMESLQVQEFPKKSAVWRVNHKLIEAVMFGQYVAEVFNQINQ